MRNTAILLTTLVMLALSPGTPAQECGAGYSGSECDGQAKLRWEPGWKEEAEPLPPLPERDDLVQIYPPRANDRYEYFLDQRSITAGKDGVMRYSVVLRAAGGAENIFREGLRCETDEVKSYGYAGVRNDGNFSRQRQMDWERMGFSGTRAYQEFLAFKVLCDDNGWPWSADEARRALALL